MAYSNVMRYTGLSGIDTASIVENLMKVEGLKYDNLYKKSTQYTYKQEAYQSVGNALYKTQSEKFDVLATNSLRKASTFNKTKTTVTDSSGNASSAVSVKLGSGVKSMDQSIEVKQLATSSAVTFTGKGYNSDTADGEMNLDALKEAANAEGSDGKVSINMTLDGVTKSVTLSSAELEGQDEDGFTKLLNSKLTESFGTNASKKASFTNNNGKIELNAEVGHTLKLSSSDETVASALGTTTTGLSTTNTSKTANAKEMLGLSADENSFVVNGKSVEITDDMTVDQFVSAFNKADTGATMSFNQNTGAFSITSNTQGETSELTFGTDNQTAESYLSSVSDNVKATEGKDAHVVIDGSDVYLSSNNMTLGDGTTLTFNAVTDGEITVKTEQDTDAAATAIKNFVETYNSLLQTIYDQTKTTRPEDSSGNTYDPLTSEESAEMSETEIEKWEENARKGLLYKDSDLTSIEKSLRQAVTGSFKLSDGSSFSLADLGITLDDDYSTNGGKLVIDEEKLTTAIEKIGVDNITEAFTNSDYGLSNKVNTVLKNTVGSNGTLTQKVGLDSSPLYKVSNTMSERISANQLKLTEMYDRLADKEDQYYKMFSYMEESIANSNSQLSALGLG